MCHVRGRWQRAEERVGQQAVLRYWLLETQFCRVMEARDPGHDSYPGPQELGPMFKEATTGMCVCCVGHFRRILKCQGPLPCPQNFTKVGWWHLSSLVRAMRDPYLTTQFPVVMPSRGEPGPCLPWPFQVCRAKHTSEFQSSAQSPPFPCLLSWL